MLTEVLKTIHVLYVEDDEIVRKQHAAVLQHFFEHVYLASNAREGLELFEKHPIQLVITDLKMPGMNGLEMLQAIRALDPKVPAFITSSYAEKEDLLQAVRLQLVDYLIKPLSYADIKAVLSRCIDWMDAQNLLQVRIGENVAYSFASKHLRIDGTVVPLPNKEAGLLELLLKERGRLVTRAQIEESLYGLEEEMPESALRNLLNKLRKKLPEGMIETHRNGGYRLL